MLIVMGGLPGTGKTTLARLLAARIGAVHLRIGTIEQAIVRSGVARHPVGPVGYPVGHALAGRAEASRAAGRWGAPEHQLGWKE